MQMADMKNVKVVFGPVYWIHNMTIVPVTTTTTTTTTTSTEATTTKRKEIVYPGMPPPLEDMDDNELPQDQQSQESEMHTQTQQMTSEEILKGQLGNVKLAEANSGLSLMISASSVVLLVLSTFALF